MRNRAPLSLLWIAGCFLFSLAALSRAQSPPVSPETPSLEKAVNDLQNSADSLSKKAKELLAVIDSEAVAKRIAQPVAQGLRWSLRNITSPGSQDPRSAFSSITMPTEDDAIMKAAQAYQETANAVRTEEAELPRRAERAVEKRCAELVGSATTAKELEPVQELLEHLKILTTRQQSYNLTNTLDRCMNQMRYLRDSFDVTPSSDPAMVSRILLGLTPQHVGGVDFGSDASFERRAASVLDPFKKALEDAQNNLDAALTNQTPLERIYEALSTFEKASSRFSGASSFRNRMSNDGPAELNAYRLLCGAAAAIQSHHWRRAESDIRAAQDTNSNLQTLASRRPAIRTLIEKWTGQIAEREALDTKQFRARLHAELELVKQPSDLAPIIQELARVIPENGNDGDSRFPQVVAARLSEMAVAWKRDDLNSFANNTDVSGQEDAAFGEELAGLRERVERDILSRTLNAPELLQAPLDSMSLANAINNLLHQFSAGGEWRRALRIMEAQAALERSPGAPMRTMEVITAVRSYLAGQNFELAELWADAAAAYKAVLIAALDGAPTQEAADRLKALAKEHPEELKVVRGSPGRDSSQILGNAQ